MIAWSDELSVNVKALDEQHQQLVETITRLGKAMQNGQSRLVIGDIIADLLVYAKEHFDLEEQYFRQFDYPDRQTHEAEHQAFMGKASEFKARHDEGCMGLSIDVMLFLSDWINTHILDMDKAYSDFFNERGLV